MQPNIKKSISVILLLGITWTAYYGSYLPLQKSRAFINAMAQAGSIRSLQDFKNTFSPALDLESPIGQEELVRNLANTTVGYMEQAKDARVATELISYIQTYYGPILERGHGMSFTQNLYVLGVLNTLVFTKTRDPRYFIAARTYTEKGAELSPTRPQFLYALFDLYRVENNVPKVQEIGNRILSQWPTDERARSLFLEYMARQTAPSPAPKTQK